jgi:hypothetical protein
MRKIKILQVLGNYCNDLDDYINKVVSETDWEEVTEERYKQLKSYFKEYDINAQYLMVSYPSENKFSVDEFENICQDRIKEIEKQLEETKKREEKRKQEAVERKKKNAEKREAKLLKELEEIKRLKEDNATR